MQIRKFFKDAYFLVVSGILALSFISPVQATQGLHYGVRTDTIQPIHVLGNWLWYSNFHTQIPSFEKNPQFWLASAGTGARGILTPYFALGFYISGGQLQNHLGKSYIVNPGLEFYFPWVKLGVHGYFMLHQVPSVKVQPIEESALAKQALDIKLSGTFLPFVRPFFSVYYISRFNHVIAREYAGSLHANWGVEWLMGPHCSLSVKHEIDQGGFWVNLKIHSAKVYKPSRKPRVVHYLKEPVEQYGFPITLLSPDTPDQEAFWREISVPVAKAVKKPLQPPDVWTHHGTAFDNSNMGVAQPVQYNSAYEVAKSSGVDVQSQSVSDQTQRSSTATAEEQLPIYAQTHIERALSEENLVKKTGPVRSRAASETRYELDADTTTVLERANTTGTSSSQARLLKPTAIPKPSGARGQKLRPLQRRYSTVALSGGKGQNIAQTNSEKRTGVIASSVRELREIFAPTNPRSPPFKLITNPGEDGLVPHTSPTTYNKHQAATTDSVSAEDAPQPQAVQKPTVNTTQPDTTKATMQRNSLISPEEKKPSTAPTPGRLTRKRGAPSS